MIRWLAVSGGLAVLIAMTSCGGSVEGAEEPVRAPLELSLRTSSGGEIDVGDLRGGLVLLAMLGTYDDASQAALESLSRFDRHHEDVVVIAVLAQQGAELLVDAYASAADVAFPITFTEDGSLLAGTTALGRIDTIPTFVSIDATGVPAARIEGFATERALDDLVEAARRAAPVPDRSNVPLLGQPR